MVSNGQAVVVDKSQHGGRCSPIVHVLNGVYPASAVSKMTNPCLEKFVTKLVQCTADVADSSKSSGSNDKKTTTHKKRPKWWPSGIAFHNPVSLDLYPNGNVRVILRQLVANCSQFFRSYAFRAKWLPTIDRRDFWNNENILTDTNDSNNKRKRKKTKSDNDYDKKLTPALALLEKVESRFRPLTTKEEFMQYLQLDTSCRKNGGKRSQCTPPYWNHHVVKLSNCSNIPLSSDVGRALALKENHCVSEEVKLKRLERSEWYTNRRVTKIADEFDSESVSTNSNNSSRWSGDFHCYKMPKRQNHQTKPRFHSCEFLGRFCRPLSVKLERVNLEKIQAIRRKKNVIWQPIVSVENIVTIKKSVIRVERLVIKGEKQRVLPKRASPRLARCSSCS